MMKSSWKSTLAAGLFAGVIGIMSGCGPSDSTAGSATGGSSPANLSGEIEIDGSSTVYPISEAVAEEFRNVNQSVKVTVGTSGTGGGFKKFSNGEIDITGASRPIEEKEIEASLA